MKKRNKILSSIGIWSFVIFIFGGFIAAITGFSEIWGRYAGFTALGFIGLVAIFVIVCGIWGTIDWIKKSD